MITPRGGEGVAPTPLKADRVRGWQGAQNKSDTRPPCEVFPSPGDCIGASDARLRGGGGGGKNLTSSEATKCISLKVTPQALRLRGKDCPGCQAEVAGGARGHASLLASPCNVGQVQGVQDRRGSLTLS